MVLVAIKHALLGQEKSSQKTLLPTTRSYDSIRNGDSSNGTFGYASTSTGSDETFENDNDGDDASSISTSTVSTASIKEGFVNPRVMSDIIIGLSDGLTVPFALTAGLSGLGDSKLVITGGLAELVSGAISMGLGGYLAAKSESEYYEFQVAKEKQTFELSTCMAEESVQEVLGGFGLSAQTIKCVLADFEKNPKNMLDFFIRFGRGLDEPADGRQFTSALTIGLSYFLGGFIPLLPYFFTSTVLTGLYISVFVMAITLFAFGSLKTVFSLGSDCGTWKIVSNGIKMTFTGAFAATAAWALVRALEEN